MQREGNQLLHVSVGGESAEQPPVVCVTRDAASGWEAVRVTRRLATSTGRPARYLAPPAADARRGEHEPLGDAGKMLSRAAAQLGATTLVIAPDLAPEPARVVAQLARRVTCPVVLTTQAPEPRELHAVLVDVKPASVLAPSLVAEGERWAEALNRPLVALTTVAPDTFGDVGEGPVELEGRAPDAREREALAGLVAVLTDATTDLSGVQVRIRMGTPARQLALAAAELPADVVVVGATDTAWMLERKIELLARAGAVVVVVPHRFADVPRALSLRWLPPAWLIALTGALAAIALQLLG